MPKSTCTLDMFKIYEEHEQTLIAIFFSIPYRVTFTSNCWEGFNNYHYPPITAHLQIF